MNRLGSVSPGTGVPAGDAAGQLRLLIVSDHALVRAGLRRLLETQADFCIVGEAGDGIEAVQRVRDTPADVLLLDFRMPRMSGDEVVAELTRLESDIVMLLLVGTIDRADMMRVVQRGARGVLPNESTTDMLFKAIRCVAAGQYWVGPDVVTDLVQTLARAQQAPSALSTSRFGLTRRECDVLALIVAGNTNKDIAASCGIREDTIKHHLTNIFDQTGVSNRLELALFAIHHQLVAAMIPHDRALPTPPTGPADHRDLAMSLRRLQD
jgi:two-component system, NarL family, nitrate/nitrite response regulator NarL